MSSLKPTVKNEKNIVSTEQEEKKKDTQNVVWVGWILWLLTGFYELASTNIDIQYVS